MDFSAGEPKQFEYEANKAWLDMLDSLVDFISASKTMIRIMNDKFVEEENNKTSDPSSTHSMDVPYLSDDTVKEIHVNSAFSKTTPLTNYAAFIQEDMNNKFPNRYPRTHSASQFLNEQYNLTKQTIARRFRPQNRLSIVPNMKNAPGQDYVTNDTFMEGVSRIELPRQKTLYQESFAEYRNSGYRYMGKDKDQMYNGSYR